MKFICTPLEGAYVIDLEPVFDERGFFARAWCREEFLAHGLNPNFTQCSISLNTRGGTLRGLHYQDKPYQEAKLVRCNSGAICDVIVDLRPSSPSHAKWFAVELSAANRRMLYAPEGFAHGFQTLADDTEVFYHITESYRPQYARGVRWDDPIFRIDWPNKDPIISARDKSFPDYIR
jgi:dTDP-4-dehydrorhamnose 3,5-epimerase